jgi:hypothetical protein
MISYSLSIENCNQRMTSMVGRNKKRKKIGGKNPPESLLQRAVARKNIS